MESRALIQRSAKDTDITVRVIPGHFATNHSHINYFIDLTQIKCMSKMANATAKIFNAAYQYTSIDTIICMERTKMVAAFLSEQLARSGVNMDKDIAVIAPEVKSGQILLRDNLQELVRDKDVLLLFANVSTGLTAISAVEALRYYGGNPVGIASLFATTDTLAGLTVTSVFDTDDFKDYETHATADCPLCQHRVKLDALVNSYGYSKL